MRLSMTSSSDTGLWKWAYGFRTALAWFFTATWAISRSVAPCSVMRARVMRPASAGMVAP